MNIRIAELEDINEIYSIEKKFLMIIGLLI